MIAAGARRRARPVSSSIAGPLQYAVEAADRRRTTHGTPVRLDDDVADLPGVAESALEQPAAD